MTTGDQPSLVLFNGFYVNVEQLLLRLEQSEESRRESEQQFKLAQSQLGNTKWCILLLYIHASLVFITAICRMDLNKSTETVASLCRQLETEKLQVESTSEQLVRVQVSSYCLIIFSSCFNNIYVCQDSLNQYVEGVTKIQSISSNLLLSCKGRAMKSEQTPSDSSEPEFLDKVDH